MSPSIWQILIVVAVILLLFGPSRIPGLGKSLGQAIKGFKKGISEDEIDVTPSSKSEKISKKEADLESEPELELEDNESNNEKKS